MTKMITAVDRWTNHAEQLHREDGPALVDDSGAEFWYLYGRFHREDGPAITYANGTRMWYFHGRLHREDGPAIIHPDGSQSWWRHGMHHREDGPATVNKDSGELFWSLGGVRYTFDAWCDCLDLDKDARSQLRDEWNVCEES